MKRTPLTRKTPLQTRKPLPRARANLARQRAPLARRTRISPESAKTKALRPVRAAVRVEALRRAGGQCEMRDVVPEVVCSGPGCDVDERKSRGVNPGGQYDVGNVQVACRAHHQWRTEHPDEAHARGLRVKSWEDDHRD